MGTELNTNVPAGMRLTVAIIGNRNAGKSTLLNRIVGQEVSIVSDEPGTTTDAVAKAYELIPVGPVSFYDTAGLDDEGELGRQRVQAAKKILRRADMVLLVIGRALRKKTKHSFPNWRRSAFRLFRFLISATSGNLANLTGR